MPYLQLVSVVLSTDIPKFLYILSCLHTSIKLRLNTSPKFAEEAKHVYTLPYLHEVSVVFGTNIPTFLSCLPTTIKTKVIH